MGWSHLTAGRRICKLLGYLGTFSKSSETTGSKWGVQKGTGLVGVELKLPRYLYSVHE